MKRVLLTGVLVALFVISGLVHGRCSSSDGPCAPTDLAIIEWLASLGNDLPIDEANYARLLDAEELEGAQGGMDWASPDPTDLTCWVEADVQPGLRALDLALSAEPNMQVEVHCNTGCRYVGSLLLDVGANATTFRIPVQAFEGRPGPWCSPPPPPDEWEHLSTVILFPSACEGTLRVHGISLCGGDYADLEDSGGGDETAYTPPDVAGLEFVGSPLRDTYPDEDDLALARSVYDLQVWDGRLYIGAGEREMNVGPVPVISYDPVVDEFVEEFVVDEEVILDYVATDERLYIPGSDATESWDSGNIYIHNGTEWTKRRTLDHAIHVFDAAEFEGLLFAAGMAVTGRDPLLGGGAIYVSEDLGQTWDRELWLATGAAGMEAYDPERPDVSGFTELFRFHDKLYAYGFGMPHLYVYEEDEVFAHVTVNVFPGVLTKNGMPCDSLPATEALIVSPGAPAEEWKRTYDELGVCIQGRIHAPVEYGEWLVYIGRIDFVGQQKGKHSLDDHYLFAATEFESGMIEQVQVPAGLLPRDLLVIQDTLYLLTTELSGDAYETGIYRTTDLDRWEEVVAFKFMAPAYSFEYLQGHIYVGFGGESPASGCIYRLQSP